LRILWALTSCQDNVVIRRRLIVGCSVEALQLVRIEAPNDICGLAFCSFDQGPRRHGLEVVLHSQELTEEPLQGHL
jgi:hypothetical protein